MTADFHKLAKDAGNKLRGYILAYASGATGVFFLALAGKDGTLAYSLLERVALLAGLALYVATVILCLIELRVDARRFFSIAQQLEAQEDKRDWSENNRYKALRLKLIYGAYATAGLATTAALVFLVSRVLLASN